MQRQRGPASGGSLWGLTHLVVAAGFVPPRVERRAAVRVQSALTCRVPANSAHGGVSGNNASRVMSSVEAELERVRENHAPLRWADVCLHLLATAALPVASLFRQVDWFVWAGMVTALIGSSFTKFRMRRNARPISHGRTRSPQGHPERLLVPLMVPGPAEFSALPLEPSGRFWAEPFSRNRGLALDSPCDEPRTAVVVADRVGGHRFSRPIEPPLGGSCACGPGSCTPEGKTQEQKHDHHR